MKVKKVLSINAFCKRGEMDDVVKLFRDILGAKMGPELHFLNRYGHRARAAWLGEEQPFRVEISESVDDNLPIGKEHARLAPTFQFLAMEVDNIEKATTELKAKGYRTSPVLDMTKGQFETLGFSRLLECTIHPKDAFGLLIELVEIQGKRAPDGEW